jgi:tryptophanyl-tRNA synthetase
MRAVTDTETEVRYDIAAKPGVSNLLSILAACTGRSPEEAAAGYTQYGALKKDTAAAVVETLRPVQARFAELSGDPAETARLLAIGATKATELAGPVLARAKEHMGFLPR